MKAYEGLTENDWKVIQIALQKLPITGGEAPMLSNLLQKVQMELDMVNLPQKERPKIGDIISKD